MESVEYACALNLEATKLIQLIESVESRYTTNTVSP